MRSTGEANLGVLLRTMEIPSASCLLYLFAADIDLGKLYRHEPALSVPGTDVEVPLVALERMLIEVAVWELIDRGHVQVRFEADARPSYLNRFEKLITVKRPRLFLARQFSDSSLVPGSLAQSLYAFIPSDEVSVRVAVLEWAGDRWPVPYDAVIGVARDEGISVGVLKRESFGHDCARRFLLPSPKADITRLVTLRPIFDEMWTRWTRFCDDHPVEAGYIERETRASLQSLRPKVSDWSPGGQ
jgi:hypothetical protein